MKKRKKKNIERAIDLKNNIVKYNKIIKLPIKDDITFVKINVINGVYTENYEPKIDLIKNINNIHLQNDDLINGRKLKDVLIKTKRILLLPTSKQKEYLNGWMLGLICIMKLFVLLKTKEKNNLFNYIKI
jgi:hypothetical protein